MNNQYFKSYMSESRFLTKKHLEDARSRIEPFINRTPLLSNSWINNQCLCKIWFKCENFQKTGSFKVRGAANKICNLKKASSICAHSSGNHAQAVAYVAKKLGLKAKIVMPYDTPQVKKNAVKGYGAEVIESGVTAKDQETLSSKIALQEKAEFIHPYNDLEVIAGAASISQQIYEELSDLDYIVLPIGGGGMASGTLISTQYFSPKTKVIGVEPYLARDTFLSLKKGKIVPQLQPITLGEGVRTGIGDVTFAVMKKFLSDIILVSQQEMIQAGKIFMERMKIVVQLSGSIVLAAILKDKRFIGKKVCCIISGGNMDLSSFFLKKNSDISAKL